MSIPVAVQLFSVRHDADRDLFGTLAQLKEAGFDGVEFFGFQSAEIGYHGHQAAEIRKVLDDLGLRVAGTHSNLSSLEGDLQPSTLDFHEVLGCRNLVIPWIPKERRDTEANTLRTAEALTALTAQVAARGFRTGFHVHGDDMHPLDTGRTAWHVLGENTPADFILQYDTGNGIMGGADPVQPIADFPGRGQTVHLKEWSREHGAKLLGEGDVPWERVFDECENRAGTEWYVIEHEDESELPAIAAVARCRENLRKFGR